MFTRHPLEAIDDILGAIAIIQRLIAKHTMASFAKDRVARLAAERAMEIISEAARHLPIALTETRPEIPWAAILDIGNFIRHEYSNVEVPIVWAVAVDNLKPLKKACLALQRVATTESVGATPRKLAQPRKMSRKSTR